MRDGKVRKVRVWQVVWEEVVKRMRGRVVGEVTGEVVGKLRENKGGNTSEYEGIGSMESHKKCEEK